MIVRNAYLAGSRESAHASANVERGQGEGVHLRPSSPDNHHTLGRHGPVGSEPADVIPQNFTDQAGTVVLIGIARHGLGTIVRPFLFKSFHRQLDSQGS